MPKMLVLDDYLTPNPYSRPRLAMEKVRGICVHWVGNPNTTSMFNRNFFEQRKDGKSGFGSAHYIIGLGGEIVGCVPPNEVAYHAGPIEKTRPEALGVFGPNPNKCLIGIETCHIDWKGMYTFLTYKSLVGLCAELLVKYDLSVERLTTHHAITGKDCPRLFVECPEHWEAFTEDVRGKLLNPV